MRIDSHHHFWNYDANEYSWISDSMSVLKTDFGPNELKPLCDGAGISGVVSVQARQTLSETDWLLEIASKNPLVRGVVGWVPLAEPQIKSQLERYSQHRLLKAVRHVIQDEPDDDFILGSAFNRGIAGLREFDLVYDILIFAKHLPNSIKFVDQHPQQLFVLDHIAKPTIRSNQFDQAWATNIRELAKRQNVMCKFSGIVTEVRDAEWTDSLLKPYWDVALEAFGADRLMYGSDWPVCLLRSSYQKWVSTVESFVKQLSVNEQSKFWSENATRAYRL